MKKTLVYFTLLFLSSSLYLTNMFNSLGSIMISAMILLIIPVVLLSGKTKFKINFTSIFIMSLYLVACYLSALYNTDINVLLSTTMIFILYIAAMVIVPSMDLDVNNTVFRALFISHLPIIVIPIILIGLNTSPYRGIFYNPNSLGTVAATLFIAFSALYIYKLEDSLANKVKFRKGILYLIALLALLFLIILSGSRTSLLATVFTVAIGVFFLLVRLIKVQRFWSTLSQIGFFTILGGIVLFVIIRFTPLYVHLYNNIIYKFEVKIARGDVLDHRGLSWSQTIREAGLFGQGSEYFQTQTVVASHNTFINILGETGWASLIFFVLFLMYAFFAAYQYAISDIGDKFKYLPLLMIIGFSVMSMGESMSFKVVMFVMFFSLASTVDYKIRLSQPIPTQIDQKEISYQSKMESRNYFKA